MQALHSKFKPLCQTSRGCPIEELASDEELTRKVDKYLLARSLLTSEYYRPLALESLKEAGLDDPSLLLECERRVKKFIEFEGSKNAESKSIKKGKK